MAQQLPDPDVKTQIKEKCWRFATHNSKGKVILKACEILKRNFGPEKESTLTLVCKDGELTLPNYFKDAFIADSAFFRAFFEGKFEQTLKETKRSDLLDVLSLQYIGAGVGTSLQAPFQLFRADMNRTLELLQEADLFNLRDAYEQLELGIGIFSAGLKCNKDDFETAVSIGEYLDKISQPEKIAKGLERVYSGYLLLNRKFENSEWVLDPQIVRQLMSVGHLHLSLEQNIEFQSYSVGDKGLEQIQELPVRVLNLSSCPVTKAGLRTLNKKTLTSLTLDKSTGDEELQALNGLSVNYLNLSQCDKITPQGLGVLKQMPNLKGLNLSWRKSADAELAALKGLPLSFLNLSESPVSAAGLRNIAGMPITSLNLHQCLITDAVVESLKGMPVTRLDLGRNCRALTDQGLSHLLKMPLTHLSLIGAHNVTNEGIKLLQKLPLQVICLHGCDQVNEEAKREVQRAIPGLQIQMHWNSKACTF